LVSKKPSCAPRSLAHTARILNMCTPHHTIYSATAILYSAEKIKHTGRRLWGGRSGRAGANARISGSLGRHGCRLRRGAAWCRRRSRGSPGIGDILGNILGGCNALDHGVVEGGGKDAVVAQPRQMRWSYLMTLRKKSKI
jgi:hypothetical protein